VAAFGFLEPFVPLYLELSGLTRGQIGLVTGIGTGLALLIQPLLGRLSDRIDARRPLMFAAAVASGCAYLFYRGADSLATFIFLTGLGINGVLYLNTANAVLVGRMALREGNGGQVGGSFAKYRLWGSIGYVVVSLLAGALLSRTLGTQATITRAVVAPIFLYAPLLFVLAALVVWLLPDPKSREVASTSSAPTPPTEEEAARLPTCERNLRRFLPAYFLFFFAYTGSAAYLSIHLKSLGATPMWITGVFAAGVVCEVLVMSQVGNLSDRFGRRPLLAVPSSSCRSGSCSTSPPRARCGCWRCRRSTASTSGSWLPYLSRS
jgi:MFS family permease